MPTSTDLVTDLPADFAVFGQAVDTSMADLKGGTTGQILSKATSTDMDFTWITNDVGDITAVTGGTGISVTSGTGPVPTVTNSMATAITTNGDLIYGTGSGTFSRLGIGSSAQVLTVASGIPSWASPGGSSFSGCFLTKSGTQSIPNSTDTAVTFDTEYFDVGGYHDNSTNNSRITIPSGKDGYFLFLGQINYASNGTGGRYAYIVVNGTYIQQAVFSASSQSYTIANISTVLSLVAGDYVQLITVQNSGGALNVEYATKQTSFQAIRLGS